VKISQISVICGLKLAIKTMFNNIHKYLDQAEMPLTDWELLLSAGWDRIGTHFFQKRYDNFNIFEDWASMTQLMPLRYRLSADFQFTKSQKAIQKHNADLKGVVRPSKLTDEKYRLFDEWYLARFNRYSTIFTWISGTDLPFPTYEICLYKHDKLVACSFFDITPHFQYSTLAFYSPDELKRSLGTYTLMCEIANGIRTKKQYHYPGHAYYDHPMYEYKKRFNNMECFDWDLQGWINLEKK
jgi:leucyl-tRNA---protein transferase